MFKNNFYVECLCTFNYIKQRGANLFVWKGSLLNTFSHEPIVAALHFVLKNKIKHESLIVAKENEIYKMLNIKKLYALKYEKSFNPRGVCIWCRCYLKEIIIIIVSYPSTFSYAKSFILKTNNS